MGLPIVSAARGSTQHPAPALHLMLGVRGDVGSASRDRPIAFARLRTVFVPVAGVAPVPRRAPREGEGA